MDEALQLLCRHSHAKQQEGKEAELLDVVEVEVEQRTARQTSL